MAIDAYVDYDAKLCHLIEINPGGRGMSSGSSLFEWRVDNHILHRPSIHSQDDEPIYVRVLSPY
jgi:hypothetical protein